jgi:GAF domain-containing protein
MADGDDLSGSLTALSQLLTGHRHLDETLTSIAEFAVQAIPGADGAALTVLEDCRPQSVGASADFVQGIEDVQYKLGEGPCIQAVTDREPQICGSLGGDPRWPRFGPRVGRLGVHSVLAVPLLVRDGVGATEGAQVVVGALNVYARAKDAFDADSVRLAELFARPAAVTVFNTQALAQTQRVAAQLGEALTSRATIDQAIGVLMSRTGATPDEAFDRLREMSQAGHVKVAELARQVMDEAVRRARARHVHENVPPYAG